MDLKEIEALTTVDIMGKTESKIMQYGLAIPTKPNHIEGEVNIFTEWSNVISSYGNISNVPFEFLGEFLGKWSELCTYTRWVEARADIEQQSSREKRETVKKQIYTIKTGGREIRDAEVYTEALYIKWEQKYTEDLALYIGIKALREGYEGRANAISREITRRTSEYRSMDIVNNRGR